MRNRRVLTVSGLAVLIVLLSALLLQSEPTATAQSMCLGLTPSGPIVIDGQDGVVIECLHITSSTGDCLAIKNFSQNVTVRGSEIGPCNGRGVFVTNSTDVRIVDNYIHPEFPVTACCDRGDGVYASVSSNLLIQGNVIAYGESNVELLTVTNAQVIGNFLLNPLGPFPRGQQVQSWTNSQNILVEENYALSSLDPQYTFPEDQQDAINFGETTDVIAKDNYIVGGHSRSGCGLMADHAANSVQFLNNTLSLTGQCGIGIASGTNQVVDGNRILNTFIDEPGTGNVALYVWNQYVPPCGPVTLSNNIAYATKPDGTLSSFWNGGGCESVTMINNTFGTSAENLLSPIETNYPPPPIPPRPYSCVAPAQYADQTGWPPCATGISLVEDNDGDGCTDNEEMGPDETLGGLRNPLNPWDFYDINGDQIVDLSNDIFGVIQHYSPTGAPPYDVVFDRGPTAGPKVWNMTEPDGVIDLTNDIFGVIRQYFHSCQ